MVIFPITVIRKLDGANGRNWPGFVILDPAAGRRAAVWAQEAWEARHKLNPINLLRVLTSSRAQRRMEYMGHEIEVQAAVLIYDVDEQAYRAAEARSMHRGYNGMFSGVPIVVIEALMNSMSADARRWVRRRRNEIEKWK